MYFGLPDDAIALREGLREVLSSACTPATIRAAWDGDPCGGLWKTLGEFGVLGLLVPEDDGGLGLDELSMVAALEECGNAGVPGPIVETVALLAINDLPRDGSARLTTSRDGLIPYFGTATHLAHPGGTRPVDDVESEVVESVDRSRAVARDLTERSLAFVSEFEWERYQIALERCRLGTAAFLLGLARRQVDLTVAYAKTRQQFGVPIGSFQAVKHPLAEAVVGTEFAWPVVLLAAHALATGAPDASMRVSHAKAAASDASYRVSRVCLQAHGAMGYTTEYDLHLFMKRTWALAADWGSASDHRMKIARELLG
jgi:alkylation response protein AidB-like acyl-CoA dehydrogenase